MKDTKKRRKLLAVASVLAATGLSSGVASGALYTGTTGEVTIENNVETANSNGANVKWQPGDSFASGNNSDVTFGNPAQQMALISFGNNIEPLKTTPVGGGADIATYDANGFGPINLTVGQSSFIGSIINSKGTAVSPLTISSNTNLITTPRTGVNASNQTQVAGNFSGLGNVTIGSGAGAAEFVVGHSATFNNNFNSDQQEDGKLTIASNVNAEFKGELGNTSKLGMVSIFDNATATIGSSLNAASVTLYDNSTIVFDTSGIFDGIPINGNASGQGTVEIKSSSLNMNSDIGTINKVKLVSLTGGSIILNSVVADELRINSGTADVDGNITAQVNFTADAILRTAAGIKIDGNVSTTQNNVGKIIVSNAGNLEITGNVGASGLALEYVQLEDGKSLVLSGVDRNHYASEFRFKGQSSILSLGQGNNTLNGNLVSSGASGNGQVVFVEDGAVNGIIGTSSNMFGSVYAQNQTVSISAGDHYVANGFKLGDDTKAAFNFADGANINGAIIAEGNNGTVTFAGNGKVTGEIASSTNKLTALNINGDSTTSLVVSQDVNAVTTTIANGGTLELADSANVPDGVSIGANGGKILISGDANHTIGGIKIAPHTNPVSVEVTETVGASTGVGVALGQVGDRTVAGANLDLLKINNNVAPNVVGVVLEDGSHITEIELHKEASLVSFSPLAPGTYKIGAISPQSDSYGLLLINNDSTFETIPELSEINFGTSTAKLKEIRFPANALLELGDNINVYAESITNNQANAGTIKFNGTHKFNAPILNGDSINSFTLANNADVKLMSNMAALSATIGDDAVLRVSQDLETTNGVNAATAGKGKIVLENTAPYEIKTSIGNSSKIGEVNFTGGDVTVQAGKSIITDNFTFASNDPMSFTLDDQNASYDAKFINNSPEGVIHNVILGKTAEFTANSTLASENNGARELNFQLSDVFSAKISTPNAQGANFITSVAGKGDIDLAADGGIINSIGTSSAKVGIVAFSENFTVNKGLYATEATIVAGKTASLAGGIDVTNGFNLGAAANLTLNDGAVLSSPVNGAGDLNIVKSATISSNIGGTTPLNSITFSDDSESITTVSSASLSAATVNVREGRVDFNNQARATEINGDVVFNNANFNAQHNRVTINGNLNINGGEHFIAVNASEESNINYDSGKIILTKGTDLIVDPGAKINVLISDQFVPRISSSTNLIVNIIENQNDGNGTTKIIESQVVDVTNQNSFLEYKFVDSNGLQFMVTDNTDEAIDQLALTGLTDTEQANLVLMAAAQPGTDAFKFLTTISRLSDGAGGFRPEAIEAVKRLDPINHARLSLDTMTKLSSTMLNRMDGESWPSSGDYGRADSHYGMWSTGFTMGSDRKAAHNLSGHRAFTHGITVGADTKVNDGLVLGSALSFVHSDVKHRDFKDGDTSKADLFGLSLYGMQKLCGNWYAKSVATFANNRIRNNEHKIVVDTLQNVSYENVRSKYHSMLFSFEGMVGYNLDYNNIAIDPSFGVRYTRIADSGYEQFGGVNVPNSQVHTKPTDRIDLLLGLKATGYAYKLGNTDITPEAHANLALDVIDQTQRTGFVVNGAQTLTSYNTSNDRVLFNAGFSLNSCQDSVDYGFGYDLHLAKRSVSHAGVIKVRVNF